MKKIVFVGGHHTAALAVIDTLNVENRDLSLFWIGHRFSMWGDINDSAEYRDVIARNIPFYDLKAGKFYHTFNPLKLIRIPFGFFQALYFLVKIRPTLIVSFGGYLAAPVVIAGWCLGIPAITHEQTVTAGFANRLISIFVKEILVSWSTSLSQYPANKTTLTGLPLRQDLLATLSKPSSLNSQPTIYITGGKQGSHKINLIVQEIIPKLVKQYKVIHQCGSSSVYNDLDQLRGLVAPNYEVKGYFNASETAEILSTCDLVVGRSGANTVYELLALGKPAILIPLPWVSHNEQYLNAKVLADAGLGVILNESDLTSETLLKTINEMLTSLEKYKSRASFGQNLIVYDAASKIAARVTAYLSDKN